MTHTTSKKETGINWRARLVALAMGLWLGVIPLGTTLIASRALPPELAPLIRQAIAVALAALAWAPLWAITAWARGRLRSRALAVVGAAITTVAGYLVVEAGVRAAFDHSVAAPLSQRAWATAARTALVVPYAVAAAQFAPRLAGISPPRWTETLNLRIPKPTPLLYVLSITALLTLAWPLTGALGDSLTSVWIGLHTLIRTMAQVLLFWGVIFYLLTTTLKRTWLAALLTIALHAVAMGAGFLPGGDGSALANALWLLPLAGLLTELRARGIGAPTLILLAFGYRSAPRLFIDPRYAAFNGSPEPQHLVGYVATMLVAGLLGLGLWIGRRRGSQAKAARGRSGRGQIGLAAVLAVVAWSVWIQLYISIGLPGFSNDGFLIVLEEQAQLESAADVPGREERIRYVYETLTETARRTQAPLRAELDDRGISYRPYYLINMIGVDGHRWLMGHFERRPGVAEVVANPNVRPYPRRLSLPVPGGGLIPREEIQANLTAIHAEAAWAASVIGEGIVVAGQDTGYDWTHPALQPHYRGWDGTSASHDTNWHDAWDHTAAPFDDGSHGTHTLGTILGDDGSSAPIGVAPGAQWIGCRSMRREFGNPGAYAACMEFFLAPYPHGGDPFVDGRVEQSPHVINNSWSCPPIEGCRRDTLKPGVEALRAAGIMMVVSSGNDGPACDTAATPPAHYDAVFSVGAVDNRGEIAFFSSRGGDRSPGKPDVVAPGYQVRSTTPGGRYGYNSGTSMAAPHVTGLVALLWSANEELIGDIEATEALIAETATPRPVEETCTEGASPASLIPEVSRPACGCGGATGVPNLVYGHGIINADSALQAASSQTLTARDEPPREIE